MSKQFAVSQELLQALANYLATRPWGEVQQFMSELGKLEPIPEAEEQCKEPS